MRHAWELVDTCVDDGETVAAVITTAAQLRVEFECLRRMSARWVKLSAPGVGFFWVGVDGGAAHVRFLPPPQGVTVVYVVAPREPVWPEEIRYFAEGREWVRVRREYALTLDQAIDVILSFDASGEFPGWVRLAYGEVWWPEEEEE